MDSVSAGKGNPSDLPEVWFGFWLFIYVIRACNSTTRQREIKSSDNVKKNIGWLSRTRGRLWWTFKAWDGFGSATGGHHLVSSIDGTCHLLLRYLNLAQRFPPSPCAAERETPD